MPHPTSDKQLQNYIKSSSLDLLIMIVASEVPAEEVKREEAHSSLAASFPNYTEMPCSDGQQKLRHSNMLFSDRFDLKERLGEGSFGQVFRCVEKETKHEFAVKQFDTTGFAYYKEDVDREVEIWRELKHRNIVTLHLDIEDDGFRYIVMDLAGGKSLFDEVLQQSTHTEGQARGVMKQLLRALGFLHKKRIIHRDVKPDNVLLNYWHDGSGDIRVSVKLADFGLAQKLPRDSDVIECDASGAPLFLAPETILEEPVGRPVDMWACGVILYLVLVGYPPFWSSNDEKLLLSILQGKFAMPSPYWDNISENAKDLIRKLILLNPEERLTAPQALKHPWFNAKQQTTVVTVTREELANSPVRKLSPGSHKKHFFVVACGIRAMLKFRHMRVRQGQGRRLSISNQISVSDESDDQSIDEEDFLQEAAQPTSACAMGEHEVLMEDKVSTGEGKKLRHHESIEREIHEICRGLQEELNFEDGPSTTDRHKLKLVFSEEKSED